MTGEEIAIAADRLARDLRRRRGLHLWRQARQKGTAENEFRLLLKPSAFDAVSEQCFLETTTIGLRWRTELATLSASAVRKLSILRVRAIRKRILRPDGLASLKVESDDIARLEADWRRDAA